VMMESITLTIGSDGSVDRSTLQRIHNTILSSVCGNLAYGYYIVRVFNIVKRFRNRSLSMLDEFRNDVRIKLSMDDLISYSIIAKEYAVELKIKQNQVVVCRICRTTNIVENHDGTLFCGTCGSIYDTRVVGIKDVDSINSIKSSYSIRQNILKIIDRFQGKNLSISEENIDKVSRELRKMGLAPTHVKCEHILKILKELKLNKHYEDTYGILNRIRGYIKIDIQDHVAQILKYHDILENVYARIKDPTRVNSLNVHFKLFKLIRLCGLECDVSDFCSLRTDQKFEEHEERWRDICRLTGWKISEE